MDHSFDFAPSAKPGASDTPTPTALGHRIRAAMVGLGGGWVEGEVRGASVATSGHCYFALADEDSEIRCVIWKGRLGRIPAEDRPRDGALVKVHYEKVDFYAPRGSISLSVDDVVPTGEGELIRRARKALDELAREGLTDPDRKRPLKVFPRRIGVIAGRESDAMTDVIDHVQQRWPIARIVAHPALVQGVGCVNSVIDAIVTLRDTPGIDVIVIARGGGSVEDLMPFSDVRLCRAIATCGIPVVTSIGHTKQTPNCDFVADAVANVPARVAELVVPSWDEVMARMDTAHGVLTAGMAQIADRRAALELQARHLQPGRRLAMARLDCEQLTSQLSSLHTRRVGAHVERIRRHGTVLDRATLLLPTVRAQLGETAGALHAHQQRARERVRGRGVVLTGLSGERERAARRVLQWSYRRVATLMQIADAHDYRKRGFAVLRDRGGRAITSIGQLTPGESVAIELADGTAAAHIDSIKEGTE